MRGFLSKLIVACWIAMALPAVASAQSGDLDPGFGDAGKVTFPMGQFAKPTDLLSDPSADRVILVGQGTDGMFLIAVRGDGSLDPGFANAGILRESRNVSAGKAVIDAQRRIIVAASGRFTDSAGNQHSDAHLFRFLPSGQPDPTFGDNGVVEWRYRTAYQVALRPDGKIAQAGGNGDSTYFRVLNQDGSPYSGFGSGGEAGFNHCCSGASGFSLFLRDLVVMPDGTLVAAGWKGGPYSGVLIRYEADGSSYSIQSLWSSSEDHVEVTSLALLGDQGDQGLVAAGWMPNGSSSGYNPQRDFAIAGLLSDGGSWNQTADFQTLDGLPQSDEVVTGSAVSDDGDVLIAGLVGRRSTWLRDPGERIGVGIARFDAGGNPDASFGSGGKSFIGFDDFDRAGPATVSGGDLFISGGVGTECGLEVFVARVLLTDRPTVPNGGTADEPCPAGQPDPGPQPGLPGGGGPAGLPASSAGNVNAPHGLDLKVLARRVPRTIRGLLSRGARARLLCSDPCSVKVQLKVNRQVAELLGLEGRVLGEVSGILAGGHPRWLTIRPPAEVATVLRSARGSSHLQLKLGANAQPSA
jgi:uncharacterized delta-60 repeat protein